MNKIKVIVVSMSALSIILAVTGSIYGWAAKPAPADTHWDITKDVVKVANVPLASYPDLHKFVKQLCKGSNTETHNIPDNFATQWWAPNPKVWFTAGVTGDGKEGALSKYKKKSFKDAYLRIGYELHLVQDEVVPAHIKYCHHGALPYLVDDMEWWAIALHSYATTTTPWTYTFRHLGGVSTFNYWLDDTQDDDDGDDIGAGDANDETNAAGVIIKDGPTKWGVPNTNWGTYGQPRFMTIGRIIPVRRLLESVPGRDMGIDYYGDVSGNISVTYEQLKKAFDATLKRVKERSEDLPPLVYDGSVDKKKIGKGMASHKITFTVEENRKAKVRLEIKLDGNFIKDTSGTTWNGRAAATKTLSSTAVSDKTVLPFRNKDLTITWNPSAAAWLSTGNHIITVRAKDKDGHWSKKITIDVIVDLDKPTGTIKVTKSSS